MKCEHALAMMPLANYGELADGERHQLETHVAECRACAVQWEAQQRLWTLLAVPPAGQNQDQDEEQLLVRCRAALDAAMDAALDGEPERPGLAPHANRPAPPSRWWPHLRPDWQRLTAPLMALLVACAGFAGGWLTRGQGGSHEAMTASTPAAMVGRETGSAALRPAERIVVAPGPDDLARAMVRIDSVERIPSGAIQIRYDTIEQHSVRGSLGDPGVRQMLLYAAQHPPNSGIRLDSLDVLGARAEDRQVRQVLIHVLQKDPNPGVRLKALESLGPLVSADAPVRKAVLWTVLHDASPGVRSQAVSALSQAPRGTAAPLLRQAGDQTRDLYLRLRIAAALQQMRENVPARWLRTGTQPAITAQ